MLLFSFFAKIIAKIDSLTIQVFSIISFIIPLIASSVGLLAILDNGNKGKSRMLFVLFLICLTGQSLFDVLVQVDLDDYLILSAFLFLPIAFLYGVILNTYTKSLLDRKYIPEQFNKKQLIPSIVVFLILIILFLIWPKEEFIRNVKCLTCNLSGEGNLGIIMLLLNCSLYLVLMPFYAVKIYGLFEKQKDLYGKYYASYELKNERSMKNIIVSFLIIGVLHLINLMGFKLPDSMTISSNLLSGILVTGIYFSGKNQLDIKKYRMYKLISHEEDIKLNR